jgi:proline iminopeptidase
MKTKILSGLLALSSGLSAQETPANTLPTYKVDSHTQGQYIKANGHKLWLVEVGESKGQPLFLIAGGPGATHYGLRSFDPLASSGSRLLYFDGHGRGKSDVAKSPSDYSLANDVEDLEAMRKELKLAKIAVLGHSYGGVVAQAYALKYPQHVSHLILANTFHSYLMWQENNNNYNREMSVGYPEVWAELMALREKGFVSKDKEHQDVYGKMPYAYIYSYNPTNFGKPKDPRKYPNNWNADLYYQMVGHDGDFVVGNDIGNFDFRKKLKDLTMPVLVIAGRYDRVATPAQIIKYKEYCPQAEFVMFEKSGHNPQVEENEKEMEVIRKFLQK